MIRCSIPNRRQRKHPSREYDKLVTFIIHEFWALNCRLVNEFRSANIRNLGKQGNLDCRYVIARFDFPVSNWFYSKQVTFAHNASHFVTQIIWINEVPHFLGQDNENVFHVISLLWQKNTLNVSDTWQRFLLFVPLHASLLDGRVRGLFSPQLCVTVQLVIGQKFLQTNSVKKPSPFIKYLPLSFVRNCMVWYAGVSYRIVSNKDEGDTRGGFYKLSFPVICNV